MHVYQLLLNKEWQDLDDDYWKSRGEFHAIPPPPQRIKHFYADDYDDIIKKLMADPSSCKNFYPLLHQLGLPHATYYQRLQGKITKLLKTDLYEEKLIVRLLPTPSGCFGGYEGNKAKPVKPIIKKQDYYQPDYSWIGLNLVNHRPEPVAFYDGDNLNHYLFTQPTSDEEIFLHSANPFAKTQVLPKVHLLLGGNQADVDLTLRGDKSLRVKTEAQAWLNELTELLASGNSPFTLEHDKALASAINYGFSSQHYASPHFADKEQVFRPDERIALLFYQLLIVLQHSSFITAQQRIGDLGYGESEGAIVNVHALKDTLKTLRALRHSEGYDKADYRYHNNQLALIAHEYLNSPLVLDGTGQDGDYESKLKQQLQQDVLHDNLSDIQSLYFNAIKLLKHLRQAGIIKHVETRKDYKLKATKLSYTYLALPVNDAIMLNLHADYKYKIIPSSKSNESDASRENSADNTDNQDNYFIGRFSPEGTLTVKIPSKWAHIKNWQVITEPVEDRFIDQYFPSLKNLTWTEQDQQNFINSAYMNGLGLINPTTALTSGLFGYLTNGKYYDSLINHSPRIAGALQVAGGIANLIFAAAAGVTGIGAPLSATIGFVAIDNIQAGARAIYTNQDTSTYGAELIAWSGLVPEKYSEIAYGLFDIGLAGKAALALKTASQSHNIIKFSTLKTSGQIKPTDMRVTVENISLNQRNVIELKEAKLFNGAESVTNKVKLNFQLISEEIAGGHAFEKHVLQQGEFKSLNITNKKEFASFIEKIISNPTDIKKLSNGRTAYWDDTTSTIVIRNPKDIDGGTSFRPHLKKEFFDKLETSKR